MEDLKVYENNQVLYFPVASNGISGDISKPSVRWKMYPIAVWDYVDPDYSDKQYWVQSSVPDIGIVPNEPLEEIQFLYDETLQGVLEETRYRLMPLSETSTIYYKDFYSDDGGRAIEITVEDAINNALDLL